VEPTTSHTISHTSEEIAITEEFQIENSQHASETAEAENETVTSKFHLSAQIDIRDVCWSFLILVGCTIIIETLVEWLKELLKETEHWLVILNQVFKELMILGLISFMLSCFKQIPYWSEGVSTIWDESIEFSHLLLFFIGLSFALLSLAVCFVVEQAAATWQNIEDTPISEMEKFVNRRTTSHRFVAFWLNLAPMSNAVDYMLLKLIFIRMHKLPENFDFKAYVQLVMLSNVDVLLDVETSSWCFLALLTLGGVAGTYLKEGAEKVMEISHPEPARPWAPLPWEYVLDFIFIGIGMLFLEFGVFLVVRRAVSRVVAVEGFGGVPTFEAVIAKLDESRTLRENPQNSPRASAASEVKLLKFSSQPHTSPKADKRAIHVCKKQSRLDSRLGSGAESAVGSTRLSHCTEEKMEDKEENFPELDLSYAFPFHSPYLYAKFNDAFLLLKCFYLALFFVFYASASCDHGYEIGLPLLVGLLFPTVFSSLVFTPMIFKLEAILNSVAQVKPGILGKVLEQMLSQSDEIKEQVAGQIRKVIGESKNQERLEKLFRDLDADGSGLLTANEFEKGLAKLGIFYSPQQFRSLCKLLNPDGGDLTCEMFINFVYPPTYEPVNPMAAHTVAVPVHLRQGFEDFRTVLAAFIEKCASCHGHDLISEQLKLYCKAIGDTSVEESFKHYSSGHFHRMSLTSRGSVKAFNLLEDQIKPGKGVLNQDDAIAELETYLLMAAAACDAPGKEDQHEEQDTDRHECLDRTIDEIAHIKEVFADDKAKVHSFLTKWSEVVASEKAATSAGQREAGPLFDIYKQTREAYFDEWQNIKGALRSSSIAEIQRVYPEYPDAGSAKLKTRTSVQVKSQNEPRFSYNSAGLSSRMSLQSRPSGKPSAKYISLSEEKKKRQKCTKEAEGKGKGSKGDKTDTMSDSK